jgi:hypothetical protein
MVPLDCLDNIYAAHERPVTLKKTPGTFVLFSRRLAALVLPDNLCANYESVHPLGTGVERDQVEAGE